MLHRIAFISLFAVTAGCSREAPHVGAEPRPPAPPPAPAAAARSATPEPAPAPERRAAPAPARPRLGSVGRGTFVYASPSRRTILGEVRPGAQVTLRRAEPVLGPAGPKGCRSGRWFAVEPKGYVCEDESTTRDLDDPLFRALAFAGPRDAGDPGEPLPFDYAFSTGAPMYGRLPTDREARRAESRFLPISRLGEIRRITWGHEDLATPEPIEAADGLPDFLAFRRPAPAPVGQREGLLRKLIPHGSMLSYRRAFEVDGRTFLLTPDLTLVPADRVRPFHPSTFHGVAIGDDVALPIGWFRGAPRPKYRRGELGVLRDSGERWAPRTWVGLTGEVIEQNGVSYYETREAGYYAREDEISVVREPRVLPKGISPDDKWIDVSLGEGTLTLFEGRRAVYSTLMSPGAGGRTPRASMSVDELVRHAYTPLGTYRVAVKYRSAQMTPEDKPDPEKFWIADVPYTQYFRAPFAIHTAYWHEDFGMPKSGGCVNLSPADARRVFEWTEPRVPDEWWSVRADPSGSEGTKIVIRR